MDEKGKGDAPKTQEDAQKDYEEKLAEHTEAQTVLIDKMGPIFEEEEVEVCILACIKKGMSVPMFYFRGDVLDAAKLAGQTRNMLMGNIQKRVNPSKVNKSETEINAIVYADTKTQEEEQYFSEHSTTTYDGSSSEDDDILVNPEFPIFDWRI